MVFVLLISTSLPAYANTDIEPQSIVVCSIHKDAHRPSSTYSELFAFSEGGTRYYCSKYVCACGSVVYYGEAYANYYWYSGKYKSFNLWMNRYIIPDSPRTCSLNPPDWIIYPWR